MNKMMNKTKTAIANLNVGDMFNLYGIENPYVVTRIIKGERMVTIDAHVYGTDIRCSFFKAALTDVYLITE